MNLNRAPYYDDFDPLKGYTQILAVPGFVLQARELTQSQSILKYDMTKLASIMLSEGDIVSGMSFSINDGKVTITPGRVYLGGNVHDFRGGTINIPMSGTQRICISLQETIITSDQDPTLIDHSPNTPNYLQPGAHRLKQVPTLVLNQDTCPVLYTFIDGVPVTDNIKPEMSVIQDILAKRLYDQSGNYKVNGLEMRINKTYNDPQNIELIVEGGTAYILGYEVTKPSSVRVLVPKSLTSHQVVGEIKTYQSSTQTYTLSNQWVKNIDRVLGVLETSSSITKGFSNTSDRLPKTPVVKVLWVSANSNGDSPYQLNTDYTVDGNSINWSPGGVEPVEGSTYYVRYQYSKVLEETTDFTWSGSQLTVRPSQDTLVNESNLSIDYSFYLHRKDRVYLDRYGNINILEGQPNPEYLCTVPVDTDPSQLSLGTITLLPGSSDCVVNNVSVTRSSMKDISMMLNRLEDLYYNQAIADLDSEAMSGESSTALKGIFTDGFIGFSKCDLASDLYDATIDYLEGGLQIPSEDVPMSSDVATLNNIKVASNKLIMSDYTEEVVVSQALCSNTMNVNSYWVFTPPVEITSIDPLTSLRVEKGSSVTLPMGTVAHYSDNTTKVVAITWTTSVDTSRLGTQVITGSIDGYDPLVELSVEVFQHRIVSVDSLSSITVYQNAGLVVPTGVRVTYSDGSSKITSIAWTNSVDTSQLGIQTLIGAIEGWSENVNLSVDVIPVPDLTPTIVSVDALSPMSIKRNQGLVVPTGVRAKYSDESYKIVTVAWRNSIDTSQLGRQTLRGNVEGWSSEVTLDVDITDLLISSVEALKPITIYQYQGLTVPTGTKVTFENGISKIENIAWTNTINTATVGTHTLRGTIEGWNREVTLSIIVLVAPVNSFTNGFLAIEPSVDNWIDTKNVTVESQKVTRKNYTSSSSFRSATGQDNLNDYHEYGKTSSTSVAKDEVITYARQIDITMRAKGYPHNTDNLVGYMDGVKVPLIPTEGTRAGSLKDTVRANPDGTVVAKFKVPQNTRTGSREIVLANDISSGSTIFNSKGILRTVTTTMITPVTVHSYIDPLAQTFCVPVDRFITGFNLYFATKDSVQPVTIQLRDVENGYPGTKVYSRVDLEPSDIQVSEDGSLATRITLPMPVFCEANVLYSVCILTESLECNMHIATLNEQMTGSTEYIQKQPYTEGVLFSSSNSVTWTAMQGSDLKFQVFGAVFKDRGSITFEPVSGVLADDLLLMVDQYAVMGTSILWEYKTDQEDWQPIENYVNRYLTYSANTVQLRASLSSTRNTSPVIDKESIAFIGYKQQLTGCYVHRLVTTSQEYTEIKVILEQVTPGSSSIKPYITVNDQDWVELTSPSTEITPSGWDRKTYIHSVVSSGHNTKFRVKLDLATQDRSVRPKVKKLMVILK